MEQLVNKKSAKDTLILKIFYESTVAADQSVYRIVRNLNVIGVQNCNIVAVSLMHPLPLPPWGGCV